MIVLRGQDSSSTPSYLVRTCTLQLQSFSHYDPKRQHYQTLWCCLLLPTEAAALPTSLLADAAIPPPPAGDPPGSIAMLLLPPLLLLLLVLLLLVAESASVDPLLILLPLCFAAVFLITSSKCFCWSWKSTRKTTRVVPSVLKQQAKSQHRLQITSWPHTGDARNGAKLGSICASNTACCQGMCLLSCQRSYVIHVFSP